MEGGFEKEIHLPSADEKVFYKFVVDDEWIVDDRAPKEDDGHYNVNNVLLPSEIKPLTESSTITKTRAHRVLSTSSAPPGSNDVNALTEAPTVSAGGEGAPLLTKEQSEANLARWIPHVIPRGDRPVTRRLTQSASSTSPRDSKPDALSEAPTVSAGGVGAPLITKEQSQANLARQIPNVTPPTDRPVTRSLAQSDNATSQPAPTPRETAEAADSVPGAFPEEEGDSAAGGIVTAPSLPATGHKDIQSSVTTSKEDYDNAAGGEGTAGSNFSVNPIPATGQRDVQGGVTTSKEDYDKAAGGEGTAGGDFSVDPIPATGQRDIQGGVTTSKEDYDNAAGGEGTAGGIVSTLPIPAEGHKDIQSSATTSKEDYDKVGGVDTDDQEVSVHPIPATGHSDIQSSVTTSKEDYERAGAFGTAGAIAGVGAGAALAGALSRPKDTDKNIIPESSLPMNPEQLDTRDTGPFINSAGPGTTTADLASQVPLEPKREAQVVDSMEAPTTSKEASSTPFITSSGPGTTTADLASQVPLEPKGDAEVLGSSIPRVPRVVTPPPIVSSIGPAATTVGLASQVPFEPKRDATVVDPTGPEAPEPLKESSASPFINSSGPGTTTAALASQVPLQPGAEAPEASKEVSGTPFIQSSGPGTTTADLASQVPIEQKRQGQVFDAGDLASAVPGTTHESISQSQTSPEAAASPEVVAEKQALEKELLEKVPESEAKGAPASAAKAQTSYYGLATAVPETVEESIAQAHASPEAATEASAVAEKSAMERELQARVPVSQSAGEPAPTISAATATTAPESTPDAAASTAAAITDGTTANEVVPDTDTSTATRGVSAGEIAGGAVAGGAAAAGVAALVSRHQDRDAEPPRVDTKQKPDITTEAAPHTQIPGASPTAAAQVSDGTGAETPGTEHPPRIAPPVEKSDADATDYAPPHSAGVRPGVSASAAAALSDGTEDPTLTEDEPVSGAKQVSPTAGIGAPSPHPGFSPIAAAALSDGTEDPTVADEPAAPKIKAPAETSEATATEYAPPQAPGVGPGVSPSAAAALSDGTEDPTLQEEPVSSTAAKPDPSAKGKAVDPLDQAIAKPDDTVHDKVTGEDSKAAAATGTSKTAQGLVHDKVTGESTKKDVAKDTPKTTDATKSSSSAADRPGAGTPSRSKSMLQRLSGSGPSTPKKSNAGASTSTSTTGGTPGSTSTTPKSTTASEGEQKKKKRNRLSQIIHKIFD